MGFNELKWVFCQLHVPDWHGLGCSAKNGPLETSKYSVITIKSSLSFLPVKIFSVTVFIIDMYNITFGTIFKFSVALFYFSVQQLS